MFKHTALPPLKAESIPADKADVVPGKELLHLIPWDICKELKVFVFERDGESVSAATSDPKNGSLASYLRERFGAGVKLFSTSDEHFTKVIASYVRDFCIEIGRLTSPEKGVEGNIAKLVDTIFQFAVAEKASDLHIEPVREGTDIRFRVDGTLRTACSVPSSLHAAVIARLKILSNLKIDEYRKPQDGRIELEEPIKASLRVSTLPTLYGEKVAIRVLNSSDRLLSLSDLGFTKAQEEILQRNIEKPFGMIVTSGPTGSGKTTTLYTLLQRLPSGDMNISTLEDPIEYALDRVNQTQIGAHIGVTFASGLRALLRQDPDVIMVGELRDSETTVMATNAAMTGHLVFTTMHTNDAPSAFTRFLEMKVEDFVVASVVNLVIAQRLVRKVCSNCTEAQQLPEIIVKKIMERKDVVAALEEKGAGLSSKISSAKFSSGKGCRECLGTGYRGRIGLFEILELDRQIHDLILRHASAEEIKSAALGKGFRDMIADGVDKVFAGSTTFEEVLRTTRTL